MIVVMDTDTLPNANPDQAFEILTASDRCDSCGAQAYVMVSIATLQLPLMFCGHHWSRYSARLLPLIDDIVDETDKLLKR
jgi:hypothetical protein